MKHHSYYYYVTTSCFVIVFTGTFVSQYYSNLSVIFMFTLTPFFFFLQKVSVFRDENHPVSSRTGRYKRPYTRGHNRLQHNSGNNCHRSHQCLGWRAGTIPENHDGLPSWLKHKIQSSVRETVETIIFTLTGPTIPHK